MEDIFAKLIEEKEKLINSQFESLDVDFVVEVLRNEEDSLKDEVEELLSDNIFHRLLLRNSLNPKFSTYVRIVNRTIRDLRFKFRRRPSLETWLKSDMDYVWGDAVYSYCDYRVDSPELDELTDTSCPWTFEELMQFIEK